MRFDGGLYAHAGEVETYPQVDEWRAEAKLLDQAGFTTVWVAEHHFFWGGWATPTPPNPILAGADLAAHTDRIRIGQCGVCLPDWHPIRVAEDIAMLDHLTGGRVDFGIIKGLNSRVNGNFNIHADRRDQERNTALFLESSRPDHQGVDRGRVQSSRQVLHFSDPGLERRINPYRGPALLLGRWRADCDERVAKAAAETAPARMANGGLARLPSNRGRARYQGHVLGPVLRRDTRGLGPLPRCRQSGSRSLPRTRARTSR